MNTTPPSLLERIRDVDDDAARRRFVDYCGPFLFHWTFRLGASRQDAVDFVQDFFVLLFEKLPHFQYDAQKSFRGWIFVALKNEWLKRQRKRRLPLDAEAKLEELASTPPTPYEEAEFCSFVTKRALEIMKAEFHEKTWKACWALVVEEKSGDVVARELGMTVPAVYKAKSNVLRRLREELRELIS